MEFENSKIKKLYKYLSSMSYKAYSDPRLISNDILCKQDSHGLILEAYLSRKIPEKATFSFAVKKLLIYFQLLHTIRNFGKLTKKFSPSV
jgi:hypothetical protein